MKSKCKASVACSNLLISLGSFSAITFLQQSIHLRDRFRFRLKRALEVGCGYHIGGYIKLESPDGIVLVKDGIVLVKDAIVDFASVDASWVVSKTTDIDNGSAEAKAAPVVN